MSSVKRYYFNGRRADLHSGYSCSEPGDNTGYYYRECDYATLELECEEAWDEAHKLQVEHDELFDEAVSLKARAEAAEAKLTSIMEWARGRCECCGHGEEQRRELWSNHCQGCWSNKGRPNWTQPQAWEGE